MAGFLVNESRVTFEGNRLPGNRDGMSIREPGSRLVIRANRFDGAAEDVLSWTQLQGLVKANLYGGAGLETLSAQDSLAVFRRNAFGAARRDPLRLNGPAEVDARHNFWGTRPPPSRIHGREDDMALGSAD